MRTAVLYDHFTPYVLMQLEELGFCPRGEARHFIAGGAIELGGGLPVNPHGGQLGEAYIHGMNGIAEAVRQVRGTLGQPGPGRRPGAGHRGHRRADQRPDPRPRIGRVPPVTGCSAAARRAVGPAAASWPGCARPAATPRPARRPPGYSA